MKLSGTSQQGEHSKPMKMLSSTYIWIWKVPKTETELTILNVYAVSSLRVSEVTKKTELWRDLVSFKSFQWSAFHLEYENSCNLILIIILAVHNFSESASNWGWREFLTIEELRGTIQNNTLHVRVELRIYGKYSTSVTLLPLLRSEGVNTFEVLSVDLGKMFNNEENSDVKIICGNETLYAHKLILSGELQ